MKRFSMSAVLVVAAGLLPAADAPSDDGQTEPPAADAPVLDPEVIARAEAIADLLQAEEAELAAELAARRPATQEHRDALALAELRALEAETLLQVGDQARAGVAFLAAGHLVESLPSAVHHELQPTLTQVQDRLAGVAQRLLAGGTLEVPELEAEEADAEASATTAGE